MSRYTRKGQLSAALQRALQHKDGVRVKRIGRSIILSIGHVDLELSADEADTIALALAAEAEEVRRVAEELARSQLQPST